MARISDTHYLRNEQYCDSSNPERRIALHSLYSVNPQGCQRWVFEQIDLPAQAIPYPEACSDAVIANHMLYHVPDRPRVLAEIRRILWLGGRLYATIGSEQHVAESYELVQQFDAAIAAECWYLEPIDFSLENGQAQLSNWFETIELRKFEGSLVVTEAMPLVEHILSALVKDGDSDLFQYIQAQIDSRGGEIRIKKEAGMFIASVKSNS